MHIVLAYKFIISLVDGAYMYYVANVIFRRFSSVWFKPTGASPRAWARLKTLVYKQHRRRQQRRTMDTLTDQPKLCIPDAHG
jgi:hypothetical protein